MLKFYSKIENLYLENLKKNKIQMIHFKNNLLERMRIRISVYT